MAPNDPFIAQRLALATYKSKLPDPLQALHKAQVILSELEPAASTDAETIGLWGAIHKRLWDLAGDRKDLETALLSYEKGFYLRNDYYNGINAAYLYNLRSSISDGGDATADFVMARRIRARVLPICDTWLQSYEKRQERNKDLIKNQDYEQEERRWTEEKYWVLATKAEAWAGLGDDAKARECLNEAKASTSPATFMLESTEQQLASLKILLAPKQIKE
jgi:hypothetical protein